MCAGGDENTILGVWTYVRSLGNSTIAKVLDVVLKKPSIKIKAFYLATMTYVCDYFSWPNINVNCEHIYLIDVYQISELFALTDLISRGQLCK